MKNSRDNIKLRAKGFTLIEMIGVLAVIAILAAVLIPKVFNAINNARINSTAMSIQTIKTAVVDHYGKYGSLTMGLTTLPNPPVTVGTPPTNQFDGVLLTEGLLDKPFQVKIGDGLSPSNGTPANTTIELDTAASGTTVPTAPVSPTETGTTVAGQAAFSLSGNGTNEATGGNVVYAIITGCNVSDAEALKAIIDGTSAALAETTPGSVSLNGRVKYNFSTGTSNAVYVYITSR